MPFTLFLYAWLSFSFCFLYSFLPSRSTLLCFSTSLFPLSSWLFFRRFYEVPSRIHGTSCPVHVVNYRVEERSRTLSSESLPPWTRNSSLKDSIVPACISRMLTIPRTIVGLYGWIVIFPIRCVPILHFHPSIMGSSFLSRGVYCLLRPFI